MTTEPTILNRCRWWGLLVAATVTATASALVGCSDDGGSETGMGTVVGRLGGPVDADAMEDPGAARSDLVSVTRGAVSSIDGVEVILKNAETGEEAQRTTPDASGHFAFAGVPEGSYRLEIDQDEFDEVAYAVETSPFAVDGGGTTTSLWLPVVSRFLLPSYPRPTVGSPVAVERTSPTETTGRVFMAVDQGLLILDTENETADLLYASHGFRSELGPRMVTSVPGQVVIITPSRIWFVDMDIFTDPAVNEVVNYDDEATVAALGDQVTYTDIDNPEAFIDTSRRGEEFDPHFYHYWRLAADGRELLYAAAGDHTAVIDVTNRLVERAFTSSGRLAHVVADTSRLIFLQEPATVRVIDAVSLEEVAVHDLSAEDPLRLIGATTWSPANEVYVVYSKLNVDNEEVPFFLILDAAGSLVNQASSIDMLSVDDAAGNPEGLRPESDLVYGGVAGPAAGETHEGRDVLVLGDSLFSFLDPADGSDDTVLHPNVMGAVRSSSLDALSVDTNELRAYDAQNLYLLTHFGEENAGLGLYSLSQANVDLAIRPVTGRVPVVILDESYGRAFVSGSEGLSVVYYASGAVAAGAEATVDLSDVGVSLLGGDAGAPCSSAEPCPDGGLCVPVDEFNTDAGTCTPQVRNPWAQFCGGVTGEDCDLGFECLRETIGNPQAAGQCFPLECDDETACPEGLYCEPACPDLECPDGVNGTCVCMDMTTCGPACVGDGECPEGYLCSTSGHCALNRCIDDSGCPDGTVCGVTDGERACVVPGAAETGEPCVSSSECASAYCRGGLCVVSCSTTSECEAGQDCVSEGGMAGYCGEEMCGGCGPDELCRDGMCDVGATCGMDEDCGPEGICVDGRCRGGCAATSECEEGETCVQGPPHVSGLFCSPGDWVGCFYDGGPGCPPGAWCSEMGHCVTGTPCYEWEPDSCPDGEGCYMGACQVACSATAECADGEECTALTDGAMPEGGVFFSCQPAGCNCAVAEDLCLSSSPGTLGECWRWTDCGASGSCDAGYSCDPSHDGTPRCRCIDQATCGPRCLDDSSCGEHHRCDVESGTCLWDGCTDDAECDAGEVCGIIPWGEGARACLVPGDRADGSPCDDSTDCLTGACLENRCFTLCTVSGECDEGQACGGGSLPPHVIDDGGIRVCADGLTCADDEWIAAMSGVCTDGSPCAMHCTPSPLDPSCPTGTCAWPMSCVDDGHDSASCGCSDAVCSQTCTSDDECGDGRLLCKDGLCRGLPVCSSDADCEAPRVCGLVPDHESEGRRCVTPGSTADGGGCSTHADCASGVCAEATCSVTCDVTSDCSSGECGAVMVGAALVSVCGTASCGCLGDEACNLGGNCGPGPLCTADSECEAGEACAESFCRTTCDRTDDCLAGEDCVGVSAALPHVCIDAGCGCADDEVCEAGACIVSRPCDDDDACSGGRCVGGQCHDPCGASSDCGAGLECVAMRVDDWSPDAELLCGTVSCDCPHPDGWCYPGSPGQCYLGTDCSACSPGDGGWYCHPMFMGVSDMSQTCACADLEVCGPPCGAHTDCPETYVCNDESRCVQLPCAEDDDCPESTICGALSTWGTELVCRIPGPKADGESCGDPGECAAGACISELCGPICRSTLDCDAGDECLFDDSAPGGDWGNMLASCGSPECFCRNDEDICSNSGGPLGECIRLEGTPCNFMTPCPTGYYCDDMSDVCRCSDLAECGPVCTVDTDCGITLICDDATSSCRMEYCLHDAECPSGYTCIADGNSRYCGVVSAGAGAVGSSCTWWAECLSGMCLQEVCVQPCVNNADCSGGQTCQGPDFPGLHPHERYPICFDWAPPCADCDGPTQFCDYYGTCREGPACTRAEDCPSGSCDGDRHYCTP